MELCRLCLTVANSNNVLSNHELILKIKECVSIEISPDENYSRRVCDACLEKINTWYEFKIMCLRSKTIWETKHNEELDTKQCKSDTIEHEYRTRRNSVIINRKNITNIDSRRERKRGLDNQWEQADVKDGKLKILEAECNVEPSIIYTEQNNMESQVYSCDICKKSFEYYTDYLDHQNDHNGEAVFHCAKCKMTFSSKPDLVQHEKAHKVSCEICGTFVQKQSMKLHLNKHTDKFKCTNCPLRFTCAPLLRDHIAARHMKLKLHFCDVCGKDFATKSSLVLHLKTHSEERQYKCKKCEYAGRTSISLKIHMSKHENNTCICEYCSKIFKSNRNLYDHLKRVHRSEKKHSCDFCGMKFAHRYLVEQHKRTHTGIHPYKCMKCFKTFARSDGLGEHLKTHNRTETFTCILCSKNFLTARGLKRHNCVMWPKPK